MSYKPLICGRPKMPDREVNLDLVMTVPAHIEDPGLEVERACELIHNALDAYGGEAEGLLVALGWRKPQEHDG